MTLDEIGQVTGLDTSHVRGILMDRLGKTGYLQLARRNGGFRMFRRLERSPGDYAKYCTAMKRTVSRSIRKRMLDAGFKRTWRSKTRRASKVGVAKIRSLMREPAFSEAWRRKCAEGGQEVFRKKLGIHDPKLVAKRTSWSLKGLRRTGRKTVGPNGERMYNRLEARVAAVLQSLSLEYEYEKRFPANNMNGFVSVDFALKGDVLIEATIWDKPGPKSLTLKRKFAALRRRLPSARFIVVTSQAMLQQYQKALGNDINVCCVTELPGLLLSTAG